MAAKKKGMSICTRGNDLSKPWFVSYYDDAGKRIRKYGRINQLHTIEERLAAAEALMRELQQSEPMPPVARRIQDRINEGRHTWRKKTTQTYQSKLDTFLAWLNGRDMTRETIAEFLIYISRTRQAATHNWYLSFFRTMLKRVGAPELLPKAEAMRTHSEPAMYFQRHQVARMKKYLIENDPELWLFCQFIYYCFIRPGELRLLKVEDILLDEWKIRVPAAVSKNRQTQVVTIPTAFRAALQPLRARVPGDYLFHPAGNPKKPWRVNGMSDRHRRALRALGFSVTHKLYSWKHTGAIGAVLAGVTVKELQIQLRHSSLEMVDKYLRQLGAWDLKRLEDSFPAI
jgi:integrase